MVLNWKPASCDAVCEVLLQTSGTVVMPTVVGYCILSANFCGLKRTLELKGRRPDRKPVAVVCPSLQQLVELAEMDTRIHRFCQNCFDKNISVGCILPWKLGAPEKHIPQDGSASLISAHNGTSCFLIKPGDLLEQVSQRMWQHHHKLVFVSSANLAGEEHAARLESIGPTIFNGTKLKISANDHVMPQQLAKGQTRRWTEEVIVSFVRANGKLEFGDPLLLRYGLHLNYIQSALLDVFGSYEDVPGSV